MNVDLPAPGTPVMPMRWAPPAFGQQPREQLLGLLLVVAAASTRRA